MTYRTYLDKFNTIIEGSDLNVGINPIAELNYGGLVTRMLLHFDCSSLKRMQCEGKFNDLSKLRHTLKITNCGSIDATQIHCGRMSDISDKIQIRASSFDIIFFLLPMEFDGGKGFDYKYTYFNQGYYNVTYNGVDNDTSKLLSTDGANWFQARKGYNWDEEGIYSTETLSKEYDKFSSGQESIIIGRQHFDIGNENISLDITDIVNKYISEEIPNYGIGVAFTPKYEWIKEDRDNYIGFITHKTPSFFEPFVETVYDDVISDDRAYFILGKENRLYLYCNIGGENTDLDVLPICTIEGKDYDVVHQFKGVYYAKVALNSSDFKPDTMLFDTWSNIVYKGKKLSDVELEFTIKSDYNWFNIGSHYEDSKRYYPTISGIKDDEQINRGDIRKLVIISRIPYDMNKASLVDNMEIRFYVKDGESEIDVIRYDKVNKAFLQNFYMLDTNMLIPNNYYVDIRYTSNGEVIVRKEVLRFTIVNNLNNKYY